MSRASSLAHTDAALTAAEGKTGFVSRFVVSAIGMSVFFVCAAGFIWGVGRINAHW